MKLKKASSPLSLKKKIDLIASKKTASDMASLPMPDAKGLAKSSLLQLRKKKKHIS